jgi:hypothetical protein
MERIFLMRYSPLPPGPAFRTRLALERIEDRSVPSILFGTTGAASVSDYGGPVINHAHVELVLWGSGWWANPSLQSGLSAAVDSLLSGPYLGGLSQYRGGIGSGYRVETKLITSSNPPSVFGNNDVDNLLRTNINNDTLPRPSDDDQFLYMVVPQPGTSATGQFGEHTYDSSNYGRFHYGWIINNGSLDALTSDFSHELAESVTDPEGNAVQVNPRNSWNWNEVGDNEAENYTYRLNNVLVQAYFSQRDHAYLVPTGQAQNFLVSSGRALTVSGDQLSNRNDTITLDRSDANGVRVTLDGETAQFEPNALSSVAVAGGTGTDTINVEWTAAGVPVTVRLGNGTDTVNLSPGANNLGNLQGDVTVLGGPGFDTLSINDQANPSSTTYALNASTVSRPGAAAVTYADIDRVFISGGGGFNTYNFADTESYYSTSLYTGRGVDTVNVQGTSGALNVIGTGDASIDTVNVGRNGSLQGIRGSLTVENPPGLNYITLDDSADAFYRSLIQDSYTPPGDTAFGRVTGLAPAPISYEYSDTRNVTVKTGSGGATTTLLATGVPTNLVGNPAASNTLVARNPANAWRTTGPNAGTVSGPTLPGTVSYSAIQNLVRS